MMPSSPCLFCLRLGRRELELCVIVAVQVRQETPSDDVSLCVLSLAAWANARLGRFSLQLRRCRRSPRSELRVGHTHELLALLAGLDVLR